MKSLTLFSIVFALFIVSCEDHEHGHDHDDGNHATQDAAAEQEAATQAAITNFLQVWSTGDLELMEATVAADISRMQNGEQTASNLDEFKTSVSFFRDGFPDLKVVSTGTYIDGNTYTVHWTSTGTNTEGICRTTGHRQCHHYFRTIHWYG